MGIQNNMTVESAKSILKSYCEQHGFSYDKLMSYKPRKTNAEWLWVKPYDGPLTDNDGNIMDLQTLPTPIISVDVSLQVKEWEGIDLIR